MMAVRIGTRGAAPVAAPAPYRRRAIDAIQVALRELLGTPLTEDYCRELWRARRFYRGWANIVPTEAERADLLAAEADLCEAAVAMERGDVATLARILARLPEQARDLLAAAGIRP